MKTALNPIKTYSLAFAFGDGENHDASVSEASVGMEISSNYVWNICPILTGVDGSPDYTIEVSIDNTNWKTYATEFTSVTTEDACEHDFASWSYIRISYNAQDATTGTLKFYLSTKAR